MSRIKGILFDKDGTLIDFEKSFARATLNVVGALGDGDEALVTKMLRAVELDGDSLTFSPHSIVIAGTGKEVTDCLAQAMGKASSQELEEQVDGLYAVHTLEGLAPFEQTATVVGDLHQQGLALGIATNDSEQSARQQAIKMGIESYMSFIAGYDSGYGGKPGPGMVLAFCDHSGILPNEVMMVGDSLHDMECGRRAGAVTVGVTSGPATAQDLGPHADHVIAGIWELEALLRS